MCFVKRELGHKLTNFLDLQNQGNFLHEHTALSRHWVTPVNKGTKGKLRPLGCAATFRRVAYGALVRESRKREKRPFPRDTQWVEKAALAFLGRELRFAIKQRRAVQQFDSSFASNHEDRTLILTRICDSTPHLAPAFYSTLSRTTYNVIRKQDCCSFLFRPFVVSRENVKPRQQHFLFS